MAFVHYRRDSDTGKREPILADDGKPKKFKYKQLPERPKASAPEATWKKYEKSLDEVVKINTALKNKEKVKDSIIERTAKRIDALRGKK